MEEEDTQLSEGRSLQGELYQYVGESLACLRKRKKASAVERQEGGSWRAAPRGCGRHPGSPGLRVGQGTLPALGSGSAGGL